MEDDEDLRQIFSDSGSDGDLDFDDSMEIDDALRVASSRTKSRRAGDARDQNLDPEVQALIGEAQQAFSAGEHEIAIKLVEEAIAADGNARLAYNLLTAIYDDIGDPRKALLARVVAAHLNKNVKDDWIEIAERSVELNLLNQAAVFYQHASRIARNDWTLLLKRASIHTELGEHQHALSLLTRLKDKFCNILNEPTKSQVLLSTARTLKLLGRTQDATALYMKLYDQNMDPARYGPPIAELNWQNLNVLAELLFEQKLYSQAIRVIRNGARFILGRADETFWNAEDDDSEFDSRRLYKKTAKINEKLSSPDRYELPIDIRTWLMACRLKLLKRNPSGIDDALVHLDCLLRCTPVKDYSDLYLRAAYTFFNAKLFDKALKLFTLLTDIPYESQEEYLTMTIQVAKCQTELGHIKQAENLYKFILDIDDNNVEALVALGEIYQATRRPAGAKLMVERVFAIRERQKQVDSGGEQSTEYLSEPTSTATSNAPARVNEITAFVDNAQKTTSRQNGMRLNAAERLQLEQEAQKRADKDYETLERFKAGLMKKNYVAANEWIRGALDLIQMFSSNKRFFPTDKSKVFEAFTKRGTDPGGGLSLDQRIDQLQNLQRDESIEENDESDSTNQLKFRGRYFEFWFWLFMSCALARSKFESLEGAYDVLKTARASNILNMDEHREQVIGMVQLSCAWLNGDTHGISDCLRQIYMSRQFNNRVLQLYFALLSSGSAAMDTLGSSNNQKFFLRQIKAVDSVVNQKPVDGAARVQNDRAISTTSNPLLLVIYADLMLLGPSYVPALTYLMRALELMADCPVLLLTTGIVHVQRALQRVSTNRHLQILQGISYFQDYRKLRQRTPEQRQEVCYNFGRLFHGLGLLSLAVQFYEAVFQFDKIDEKYSLDREAAYNLHLIYAISGNMQKARNVIDTYLTI